ncbi:RluA family pseudouridine synthase [Brevibacillus marinus]|uniref:RluA family pseudouridine synthase n=1 Tax=Brevibacillus marinus TaxID=2496837 RepID=UPI000F83D960|nr:RluA family pseudouridine synthase [Brevibacillus marinus]
MAAQGWLEYVVAEQDEGLSVEQIVREKLAVSGRMLQRLTRSKGIRLNGKSPYLQRAVKKGDRIAVRIADKPGGGPPSRSRLEQREPRKQTLPVEILYEDEQLLVANKPAGLIVHPVRETDRDTLAGRLAGYFQARGESAVPHPVHRLDKDTSGAVLFAKSSYAHQLADKVLRTGQLHREYLALLCGNVEQESGTIRAAISRDGRHPTKRKLSDTGEPAVTHYEVLARGDDTTLVRIWLETGKTHQIRVHFASLGHPLVGDRLYGGTGDGFFRQALHAHRLSFPHPLHGTFVEVSAPLPDDFRACLQKAGKDVGQLPQI